MLIDSIKCRMVDLLHQFEPTKNKWSREKRMKNLKIGYLNDHGRELSFEKPVYFTEKIQWYKVFYCNKDMERAVDKFLFKGYIKDKLGDGFTIPYYNAWTTIRDFERDWDSLPETFVLKSTLQSDGKCIRVVKDKSKESMAEIKKEVKKWLRVKNTLINSYCSAYYQATPRILAEQYVSQIDDDQLYDYKVFCFEGVPYCVNASMNHFRDEHGYPITYYDLDWKKMDVTVGTHSNDDIPKPAHFNDMISIAGKLSKDFPFVRVDFFDTQEKLYCAELTFYPGGGNIEYTPSTFDIELGNQFMLPQ